MNRQFNIVSNMRRGIRGKWKRPHQNSSGGRHPPGLTGKDIGLYYRNKQMKKANNTVCEIKLEVPENVVLALKANIRSIEDIAQKENIYIEPIKQLIFIKTDTDGADFIPLKAMESDKQSIHVTNIFPRDNDVIFVSQNEASNVKNKPSGSQSRQHNDVMVISDDSSDAFSLGLHSQIMLDELKLEAKHKTVKVSDLTEDDDFTLDVAIDEKPVLSIMNPKDEPEEVIDSSADEDGAPNINLDTKPIKPELDIISPVVASGSKTDGVILQNFAKYAKPIKSEIENYIKPIVATDSKADELILMNVDLDTKPIKSELDTKIKPVVASGSKADEVILLNVDMDAMPIKLENKTTLASGTSADEVVILDDNDSDVELVKIETDIKASFLAPKKYLQSTSRARTLNHNHSKTGKSDYKYGYDDIITGTFEEKLIESLSKGISVNIITDTTKELSAALLDEYNIMVEETPKYNEMKKFRKTLPTFQKSKDLLNVVNNNQVVVISGETGCGKSTQVPQIILDDAIKNKRGANVKILVTQPRRIAASSLAMRVAEERAESMGKSVGYSVRLERVECRPRASIMFCTTGVLLVELEVNQSLSNYSHIILDEVHERDCQIDISMCMLRQVLKKRKDLKLILMSATIDAETLCSYYDDCPMLHIEGLAFPVQDVYLEQILQMTHYRLPPSDTKVATKRPEKPWMRFTKGTKCTAALEMEQDIQYKAEIGPWLESIKKSLDRDVYQTLQDRRIELLDVNLIFQLLLCISNSAPGAILVFLPGIAEITKLIKIMRDSRRFPESYFDIHPLHSKLPTLTQHKIFRRPSGNIRKIIIATNIAETSITIDDIVYVVDCAKIKYSGLNVDDHVSTLQTEWASQANLRQRRGRAGRCQPGICYHMVTSFRASKLAERLLPELQRNDLLEPVLQIKRLRLGFADSALKMMPAVPDEKTIKNAVRHLQQCGALDKSETLTPLGWHLARLPVHPAAGKLLLLGALFGCLERAASVAAVWGFKDPFQFVIGKQKEVEKAKKTLALGEPSDHIAMSEALMQWERCESYWEKSSFAHDYFLSMSTLKLLSDMKKQFGQNLKQMGFLHSGDVKSIWENRNVDNLALFKAIVAASLYPNIATVRWKNMHFNARNPRHFPSIKVKTPEDPSVMVHPSSVMFTKHHEQFQRNCQPLPLCSNPGANWLVYWLKQRSSELYLIDVTLVYTLPLLFFGELNLTQADNPDECLIDIKTIKVCCDKETTQLLFQLRSLLDQVIASKIMVSDGEKRSSIFEEHVLNAVIRLITAEDARTQYLDDDDLSGSDDYDGRSWY